MKCVALGENVISACQIILFSYNIVIFLCHSIDALYTKLGANL